MNLGISSHFLGKVKTSYPVCHAHDNSTPNVGRRLGAGQRDLGTRVEGWADTIFFKSLKRFQNIWENAGICSGVNPN